MHKRNTGAGFNRLGADLHHHPLQGRTAATWSCLERQAHLGSTQAVSACRAAQLVLLASVFRLSEDDIVRNSPR